MSEKIKPDHDSPVKRTIYADLESIRLKNEQQIQADIDLVDLYTFYSPEDIQLQPISEELRDLLLNPESLSESLQSLRSQQVPTNKPSSNEAAKLLNEYESYLANLRQIRRFQKAEIQKALQDQPEISNIDKRKVFLEAITFSGVVGEMIIKRLQDELYLSDDKISTEQIQLACQSKKTFLSAIENLAISKPQLIASNLEMIQKMFDNEELQHIVNSILRQGISFNTDSLKVLIDLTPENQRQAQITQLFADFGTEYHTPLMVDKFIDLSGTIGEEKSKKLALQALNGTSIMAASVRKLIGAGLLTSEDVKSAIVSKTARTDEEFLSKNFNQLIDFAKGGLLAEEQLPLAEMIEKMAIESLPFLLERDHIVAEFNDIFTTEKIRKIHSLLFETDPVQYELTYGPEKRADYLDGTSQDIVCEAIISRLDLLSDQDYLLCETLMSNPSISIEEKRSWLENYRIKNSSFLYNILGEDSPNSVEVITSTYSPDEITRALKETLIQDTNYTLGALSEVLDYIEENKREDLINDFIQSRVNLGFVSEYNQIIIENGQDFFGPNLNKNKLESQLDIFLDKLQHDQPRSLGYQELKSITETFGLNKAKEVVDSFLAHDPTEIIQDLEFISNNYTPEEYREILLLIMNDKYAAKKLIINLDSNNLFIDDFKWPSTIELALTRSFLNKYYIDYPKEFVDQLIAGKLNQFFNDKELEFMIESLTINHPITVLNISEQIVNKFPKFTTDYIIQKSQEDEIRSFLAPKTSSETINKLAAGSNPESNDITLKLGKDLDATLAIIRQKFSPEAVKHLAELIKISGAYELEICDMLALIGNTSDNPSEVIINLQNREELELLFIQSLCNSLGIDASVNDELLGDIKNQVQLLTKVGVYSEEIQRHPNLKPAIAGFVRSIIAGEYQQWRFGEPTIENLTKLQDAELIPDSLSLEQYNLWTQELNTSKEADQSESIVGFVGNFRKIIEENIQFLDLAEPSALETSSNPLEIIKNRVSSLGQSIGKLNKNLQALRALEPSKINTQEIDKTTKEVATLKDEQAKNQITLAVMTIQKIDAELSKSQEPVNTEQSGSIIKEIKKQIALLTRLLKDQETNGLIARLNYEINALESSPEAGEKITIKDSSDAKTTFEIGERPVGSCQSYRTGQFRECLMSYFNQNTKIIIVENENGKPIARAVLRLLDSSDGKDDEFKPCLFLETIYSAVGLDAVSDAIIAHATAKAEQLGIPLLLSPKSQNEHGDFVSNSGSDEFQFVPSSTQLVSRNSNAPYVYSDAIGSNNSGKYKLSGLAKVEKVPV